MAKHNSSDPMLTAEYVSHEEAITSGEDVVGTWATEALSAFADVLAEQLGLDSEEMIIRNVATGSYAPGTCAGTISGPGGLFPVGVYGPLDSSARQARMLTPVTFG